MRIVNQLIEILILGFCLSFTESHVISDDNTLIETDNQPLIKKIFGYYVDIKSLPKSSILDSGDIFYCGGTIIGSRWIITHPRCCKNDYNIRVFANTTEHCTGNELSVLKCEIDDENNIALIETHIFSLTNDIYPMQLPRKSNPYSNISNERAYLAGRKYYSVNVYDFDDGLREMDLDFSFNTKCVFQSQSEYCAALHHSVSGNIAYIGSPLILKSNEGLKFIGILKLKTPNIAIFSKIINFIEWIENKTGISLD